jgi:hypothetical protein
MYHGAWFPGIVVGICAGVMGAATLYEVIDE